MNVVKIPLDPPLPKGEDKSPLFERGTLTIQLEMSFMKFLSPD